METPDWLAVGDGALVLTVHVQPGAAHTGVAGVHGDALKVRLRAPPVDGKANEALLGYLGESLGVPRRNLELVSGQTSRRKRVRIAGASVDALLALAGGC